MKKFVFLLAMLSPFVWSGETKGKVGTVWVHGYNDFLLFNVITTKPGYATCAVTQRYAISTSTQQGKNILAVILSAKASGQVIIVGGAGGCNTHGDAEDISAIAIE